MNTLFQKLNPEQQRAVETTEGRLLILAGAGSGKTSVLIARIIHLLRSGKANPSQILALTFTNKAAHEMRHRIAGFVDSKDAAALTLSTFHSFCYTLLKTHIHHLGYTSSFSLYEERDIKRLVERVIRENLGDHEGELPSMSTAFELLMLLKTQSKVDDPLFKKNPWFKELIYSIHSHLPAIMKAYNALDFDDLLTLTVTLLKTHPSICAKLSEQYRYIMIDEYQDTNPVQDELANLLASSHGNLCVVGDDDQSIYSWRGVNLRQILDFRHDHMVKLVRNYRSSASILQAANALIAHNKERFRKELTPHKETPHAIDIFHAPDEIKEAQGVIQRIINAKTTFAIPWSQIAILYRSNHLSKPFEMALLDGCYKENGRLHRGIPYEVVQGTSLTDRSEIRDLVAVVRYLLNPKDEESLLRIIGFIKPSISSEQLKKISAHQRATGQTLRRVLEKTAHHQELTGLSGHSHHAALTLITKIAQAQTLIMEKPLKEALLSILELFEYRKTIESESKSQTVRSFKWENILSFIDLLDRKSQEYALDDPHELLSLAMLDNRRFDHKSESEKDAVQLLTFHSAKGLEFECSFLVALEERILPHEKSLLQGGAALEEERRLFYVALTRAKRLLTLSMTQERKIHGKPSPSTPSRFLFEIPQDLLSPSPWDRPFIL